jgi:hypothetical protein
MKIFQSRKLTDAEFVERIRKQLQKRKRWAWLMLIFSGVILALFFWFLFIAIDFAGSWSTDSTHDQRLSNGLEWYRIGFVSGSLLGGFAMLLLVKVTFLFLRVFGFTGGESSGQTSHCLL